MAERRNRKWRQKPLRKNSGGKAGSDAGDSVRLVLCLVRSLKIWKLKGYVGGLGASASKRSHIGLVAQAMI
jgi:hypothetical protein